MHFTVGIPRDICDAQDAEYREATLLLQLVRDNLLAWEHAHDARSAE